MDIRRALSIGGAAVVAAAVGGACSFAFSGAVALKDATGVQVSDSAVIVPSTRAVDTEFRTPRSPDAAGPETVPAPEPHDLAPTTPRGSSAGPGPAHRDAGSPRPGGAGAGAAGGDGHVGAPRENPSDRGTTTAPGLVDGARGAGGAGEQWPAHSNREQAHERAPGLDKTPGRNDARGERWPTHSDREQAHERAPGLNKVPGRNDARGQSEKRPGNTEERDQESRHHVRGSTDRSSGPDGSCAGGGYEQSRDFRPRN